MQRADAEKQKQKEHGVKDRSSGFSASANRESKPKIQIKQNPKLSHNNRQSERCGRTTQRSEEATETVAAVVATLSRGKTVCADLLKTVAGRGQQVGRGGAEHIAATSTKALTTRLNNRQKLQWKTSSTDVSLFLFCNDCREGRPMEDVVTRCDDGAHVSTRGAKCGSTVPFLRHQREEMETTSRGLRGVNCHHGVVVKPGGTFRGHSFD